MLPMVCSNTSATRFNLAKRLDIEDCACPICHGVVETDVHVFLDCQCTREAWDLVGFNISALRKEMKYWADSLILMQGKGDWFMKRATMGKYQITKAMAMLEIFLEAKGHARPKQAMVRCTSGMIKWRKSIPNTLSILVDGSYKRGNGGRGTGDCTGSVGSETLVRRDAFAASSATACYSASTLLLLLCRLLPCRDCATRTRVLGAPPVLESGPLLALLRAMAPSASASLLLTGAAGAAGWSAAAARSKPEPVEETSSKKSRVGVEFSDCEIIGDPGLRKLINSYLYEIRDELRRRFFLKKNRNGTIHFKTRVQNVRKWHHFPMNCDFEWNLGS
ncbi:hypothetical protein M9H77_22891 [Catharanthus roseus]|uniref:Uncharacterized protein n=1 Tax=Catharanthus roseus TaxID=4058 RepID=A0ACC0ARH1_CATRO|nr:hypothetical protein M9H77_22891 [Catharanthus roseus]